MKLVRHSPGTLHSISHNGRVELHRFCGSWFIRRDGRTIAERLTTVLEVHEALRRHGC